MYTWLCLTSSYTACLQQYHISKHTTQGQLWMTILKLFVSLTVVKWDKTWQQSHAESPLFLQTKIRYTIANCTKVGNTLFNKRTTALFYAEKSATTIVTVVVPGGELPSQVPFRLNVMGKLLCYSHKLCTW